MIFSFGYFFLLLKVKNYIWKIEYVGLKDLVFIF